MTWDDLIERALATLSLQERESGTVYLDERVVPAGTSFVIDKSKRVARPYDVVVVFIDLAPMINWGHSCRYLLINVESGEIEDIPAQFPPFLYAVSETLRLVWQGTSVPNWTVVVHDRPTGTQSAQPEL